VARATESKGRSVCFDSAGEAPFVLSVAQQSRNTLSTNGMGMKHVVFHLASSTRFNAANTTTDSSTMINSATAAV
jgi:hypothetical protein